MRKGRTNHSRRGQDFAEFRNIRVLPSGYQVCVTRDKKEFSKHFAGHSTQSLRLAENYRDKLLRRLPQKRRHAIPKRILSALRLKQAVVGVSRYPKGCYAVLYRDRDDRVKTRTFSWRKPREELAAYKAAIQFRRKTLRG